MIQLYYGWGKGKTCSAVGQVMRMIGHSRMAMFCQFLKDGTSGEVSQLLNNHYIHYLNPKKYLDKESNEEVFLEINKLTKTCKYDIIVLDEILDAIDGDAVSEFDLAKLIFWCDDNNVELVITGHNAPSKRIMLLCDYITKFEKIKHPYDKGILAREGIEW